MIDLKPTIILIDTPDNEPIQDEASRSTSPSPHSSPTRGEDEAHVVPDEDTYGLLLLSRIVSEAHLRNVSKLVVPIPLVSTSALTVAGDGSDGTRQISQAQTSSSTPTPALLDRRLLKRCLDLGARDVMVSPLQGKSVTSLEVHAYRAHKDAARDQQALLEVRRGRKRSWVGMSEDKPFSYLREAMVSNLMKRICQMGQEQDDFVVDNVRISVSDERKSRIACAIGRWHFCAHDFSDDELVVASSLMFKHAFAMPELAKWRIPAGKCWAPAPAPAALCCVSSLTASRSRPTHMLFDRLPRRLQQLCALSQFPPRRRRPAGDIPLFARRRGLTSLSGQERGGRGAACVKVANGVSDPATCGADAANHGHWARRRPPGGQQRLSGRTELAASAAVQRPLGSGIVPLRGLLADPTEVLALSFQRHGDAQPHDQLHPRHGHGSAFRLYVQVEDHPGQAPGFEHDGRLGQSHRR